MPLTAVWSLSQEWYGDRLDPNYQPADVGRLQQMLTDVGLTDAFWQLR